MNPPTSFGGHTIPVPTRLQRPQCSCGWTPPLPWPVSWERWDADAEAHLANYLDCALHGVQELREGRCSVCRRATKAASDQRRKERT